MKIVLYHRKFYSRKIFIASENDEIDQESKLNEITEGLTCKFGKLTLKRGEKLIYTRDKIDQTICTCQIPPFITCLLYYIYPMGSDQ